MLGKKGNGTKGPLQVLGGPTAIYKYPRTMLVLKHFKGGGQAGRRLKWRSTRGNFR